MKDEMSNPICDIKNCPGYGTAHPPLEKAVMPQSEYFVIEVTTSSCSGPYDTYKEARELCTFWSEAMPSCDYRVTVRIFDDGSEGESNG